MTAADRARALAAYAMRHRRPCDALAEAVAAAEQLAAEAYAHARRHDRDALPAAVSAVRDARRAREHAAAMA